MYHCHLEFYWVGPQGQLLTALKSMAPLEHFTHSFTESDSYNPALAAGADVIFVCLQKDVSDPESMVKALLDAKKAETDCIVLSDEEQLGQIVKLLPQLKDIWRLPMSGEELRFRFLRWQQSCKREKDAWQTSQYLEATINSIPNLVWYKDKNGIHEKVNDSFCRTVNKPKENVQGQGHAYIWDVEQDDPACVESEREVMTKEVTCVSEETIQTGEGERLLTTYKSPLYDLDGSVMGTVGVAIDITKERGFEQEILRKTNMLEAIFTAMECGVICHSLDGSRIININDAALHLLGYSSIEELNEQGFFLVAPSIVDEDKPIIQQIITDLKDEGDSVNVEYRVCHSDGKIVHILGNFKLIKENDELFCQRLLLDITTQRLKEQQERTENQQRQTELIQALAIDYNLVCFFDLNAGEGRILRINDCPYHRLIPFFEEDTDLLNGLEQYIQTCVYVEDQEMMRQALSLAHLEEELKDKSLYYVNYRTLCGSEMRYFQMKVVRAGRSSRYQGIVLGFRSIDEEFRESIRQKNQLEEALQQAKQANKAKSVFLSNMSHDIRTPMNAIVGFTSLAISHIDRPEQVENYLQKIMASGNHLLSLINDILTMSHIESGKIHLDEELYSLPEILHGLRNIIQTDITAKQLDLHIDTVDVVDEEIYCDKLRLNQVLLNLLSNSIKYTGAGGTIAVRISEKSGAPEGFANFEFRVKDTGIGMSEEFLTHLFEPFERERNSTISGIQGTGLGMSITRNIVDMMKGSITVTSKQGVGTEFVVNFTFRLHAKSKKVHTITELRDCRALVVDDDFNTCDSVSYMLQQMGLRAEWTLSGKEAVLRTRQAMMRGDSYSVYVIDWLMPDMNGVEVARRIRKETGGNVPIIVLTAYDWSDIEEDAREAGVSAFCCKPLFLSELRSCLHSITHAGEVTEKKQAAPRKIRSGRVLLAEDNELNQEIAEAILEEAGFTVEIASNGQIAVEMLQAAAPDYYQIVLMDVQMPVMDGYEAAKTIRSLENPELSSIPILAMTANAFEEDKQEALRCGMNGHIAKPIDIAKLMAMLDEILEDAGSKQ